MRDCRALAKVTRLFPGIVFASCHARIIRNVRHPTSVQSFYLCCRSGWVDVPDCRRNCQLAVGDDEPIPCSWVISWVTMLPVVVLAAPLIRSASFRQIQAFAQDVRFGLKSGYFRVSG
jgi:hypothetical protein